MTGVFRRERCSSTENPRHSSDGKRIVLRIEYDGSAFSGWQRQAGAGPATVQAALEAAIGSVADASVKLVCAGRTDAGVHATCQIAHFDCPRDRGERAWTVGVNSLLPNTVRVHEAFSATDSFSARFSAVARRYVYLIYEAPRDSALLAGRALRVPGELDAAAMGAGARHLLGELDFSSFRAAGCQSNSPFRDVQTLAVYRHRGLVVIDIRANAFLQHMVRNIVGSLLAVGRGEQGPDWIREVLLRRDRRVAAATVPPAGLYLVAVTYPSACGIPIRAVPPPLLDSLPTVG